MYALNLEQAVECYIKHKISLGLHFRQESWLLRYIQKQVVEDGRSDLDAIAYEHWNNSIRDRHANTRRKWQQIVYNFCLYRRRSDPAAFVPEAEGFARRRPYVTPVIVEPEQISRMLILATGLSSTGSSPLRGPCMRLAVVLLYTCGLRLGRCCDSGCPTSRTAVAYCASASPNLAGPGSSRCQGVQRQNCEPIWAGVVLWPAPKPIRRSCAIVVEVPFIHTVIQACRPP